MKLITLTSPAVNITDLALLCQPGDTLLLRQDAVYLARRSDIAWPCDTIVALTTDLDVRQIIPDTAIRGISTAEWVELTASAKQVILWR
jgi:sulfur relay protein TusB/DsrH